MKRSLIQKIIIPRNWLFGRIACVLVNLINLKKVNKLHFTPIELAMLDNATLILKELLENKKLESTKLKTYLKTIQKENE